MAQKMQSIINDLQIQFQYLKLFYDGQVEQSQEIGEEMSYYYNGAQYEENPEQYNDQLENCQQCYNKNYFVADNLGAYRQSLEMTSWEQWNSDASLQASLYYASA